jgi:hypothetical protein
MPINKSRFQKFIISLLPPAIVGMMKYWRKNEYGFFGNFTSWEKARRQTSGYDLNPAHSDAIGMHRIRN